MGPLSFDQLIDKANTLGAMQASAIWAFVCIILFIRTWLSDKKHAEYDKQWQEIRIREALADQKMADAVSRLADQCGETAKETIQVRIILDERIPKGGKGNV